MLTIGIDPDLHDTAIAVWNAEGPHRAVVAHVKRRKVDQQAAVIEMADAIFREVQLLSTLFGVASKIAVEAQTLQRGGWGAKQHKRPGDIVVLGNVAGVCLAAAAKAAPCAEILFPTPEGWKGQLPKEVMQARLYDQLGWGYDQKKDYAVPLRIPFGGFGHILTGQWKHVGDALLLAKWAREQ